jgi:AraC-like DNA-binding protein
VAARFWELAHRQNSNFYVTSTQLSDNGFTMQTAPAKDDINLSNKDKINLTSLNVVREELVITIEQAATQLEGFVSDRENSKLLQSCIQSLQQIRGSLELIELHGACELAGELLDTARQIDASDEVLEDEKLSALTKGFFVLSCYFEYALQQERGMPSLMIPYINDIRISNRQPILWESNFAYAITSFRLPKEGKPDPIPHGDSLEAMARRFRHMYQVGLLGLIKEVRITPSLQLMQRAVDKVSKYAKGSASETFWWLLLNTIESFSKADMALNLERKRLFSHLDREFKRIEKDGEKAFTHVVAAEYLKELSYYVALAALPEEPFSKIKVAFGYSNLGYDEQKRLSEAKALTGPSASTVSSVAETLKSELRAVKEAVEFASESDTGAIDSYDELIASITKIRDILDVVGLKSASQTMKQQLERVKSWREADDQVDPSEIIEVADAFIYVESVLDSIEKRNFSDEKLAEINQLSRNQMIVSSHLADAQLVVLEEAESGLTMVKRALNSYADSSYDRVHIKNVAKTMNGVRGGMIVLELPRAAAVVASCVQFIEGSLLSNNQPAALEHMLETFADALICLEYYLDCLKVDKTISSDTLVIAEESLAALGYGVSYTGA